MALGVGLVVLVFLRFLRFWMKGRGIFGGMDGLGVRIGGGCGVF